MIVGVVADVHVENGKTHAGELVAGVNERCRRTLDCLRRAVETPGPYGKIEALIVAGDLFDSCKPLPQIIRAVGDILRPLQRAYLIVGNHDQHSSTEGDHALSALGLLPNVQIIDKPTTWADVPKPFMMLPYGYDLRSLQDPKYKNILWNDVIVIAHHGIRDDNMANWTRDKGVPVDEIEAWLTKHNAGHPHRSWLGGRIQQIGALAPVDWRNPGFDAYGSVIHINTERTELVPHTGKLGWPLHRTVVRGPRFVVSGDPEDNLEHEHAKWLYVRTKYPLTARDFPPGTVVEPSDDVEEAEGRVRVVSQHVADAVAVDDQIHKYVAEDPTIPTDLRSAVLQTVLNSYRGLQ
jgi:hypothetical protein